MTLNPTQQGKQHIFPPIPDRSFDWLAYVDGEEEKRDFSAYAPTETEALKALCDQLYQLYLDK
jgi:hypothetical protein